MNLVGSCSRRSSRGRRHLPGEREACRGRPKPKGPAAAAVYSLARVVTVLTLSSPPTLYRGSKKENEGLKCQPRRDPSDTTQKRPSPEKQPWGLELALSHHFSRKTEKANQNMAPLPIGQHIKQQASFKPATDFRWCWGRGGWWVPCTPAFKGEVVPRLPAPFQLATAPCINIIGVNVVLKTLALFFSLFLLGL